MKKNKTLKRFLAFLLCAAMVITYMPSSVFTFAGGSGDEHAAAAEEVSDSTGESNDVPTTGGSTDNAAVTADSSSVDSTVMGEAEGLTEEEEKVEEQDVSTENSRDGPSLDSELESEETAADEETGDTVNETEQITVYFDESIDDQLTPKEVKVEKGKAIGSKAKKALTFNKKNGRITVRKGTKKGTYKMTVTVRARGTGTYMASKTFKKTVKFVVR